MINVTRWFVLNGERKINNRFDWSFKLKSVIKQSIRSFECVGIVFFSNFKVIRYEKCVKESFLICFQLSWSLSIRSG